MEINTLPNISIDIRRFLASDDYLNNIDELKESLNIKDENIAKVIAYEITPDEQKDVNKLNKIVNELKDEYINRDLELLQNISSN
jgi:hypothetical protein